MRYILFKPTLPKDKPFFRIGNEGVSKKELLEGFIEAEMPDNLVVTRFGDLYITDLDTFYKIATAKQKKEVEKTLKLFSNVG